MDVAFCPYCGTKVNMATDARCSHCDGSIQFAVIESIPETVMRESPMPLDTKSIAGFRSALNDTLKDIWDETVEVNLRKISDYTLAQQVIKKQFGSEGYDWEQPNPYGASGQWFVGSPRGSYGHGGATYAIRRPYYRPERPQRVMQMGSPDPTYVD